MEDEMNGIVVAAPLAAVIWGTYGLSVHQFGFARGSLVWFAGTAVAVCVGGAAFNRAERRRVAEQQFVDDTIDAMEADWHAPPSMWN